MSAVGNVLLYFGFKMKITLDGTKLLFLNQLFVHFIRDKIKVFVS